MFAEKFFQATTGQIPSNCTPMGATDGKGHSGWRHHWVGKKFAPQHIGPHLNSLNVESRELV